MLTRRKKRLLWITGMVIVIAALAAWLAIRHQAASNAEHTSERSSEAPADTLPDDSPLPDTLYPSALVLEFEIRLYDTITSGELDSRANLYRDVPGVFTFRGDPARIHSNYGKIIGNPSHVITDWTFRTPFDTVTTDYGRWGGGTGWTGQPLWINWPDTLKHRFPEVHDSLIFGTPDQEIIFASLCGDLFFLDPETGNPTRSSVAIGNTLKGTPGIDPAMNGLLYVGHGIPKDTPIGISVFNLFTHKNIQFIHGIDPFAWKRWGAFDSSPIAVGQFLFWPGENGLVYKFIRTAEGLKRHSSLRYRIPGNAAPGIESSMAVFKNYGYFGDNHGNILCINLNNLQPVWHYHNLDDTDATIVIEAEDGIPYLFTGSQVDRQGDTGVAQITKLNGLNGAVVWQQQVRCKKHTMDDKTYDGGMLSTPLPGNGNCKELLFAIISLPDASVKADLIAFRKKDGATHWKLRMDAWSWSSPVPFYNEHDSLFLLTGDVAGNVYLIEGTTGKVLFKEGIGQNFESSPLVMGNSVIFGSRGRSIYKLSIL